MAFIYVVRIGDFVKIGMSRDWKKRVANLKTSVPFDFEVLHVEVNDETFEASLHKRFRKLHHRGEWFNVHPILLAYITRRAEEAGRSFLKRPDTDKWSKRLKEAKASKK